ncbi:FG-GAP repeat protein [Leptospira sp. 'Mane']|uniref:FG-GAP repeat protein n=1 Tax=Leptospira sp. 'Mane' TaxID=3387407 RepID=UPI00398B3866
MLNRIFHRIFLKWFLLAVLLGTFSYCWANPIIRPSAECLVKIHNSLCPKEIDHALFGLFFLARASLSTVTISNLSDHSVVKTGFLIGKAASDIKIVYISLDGVTDSIVEVNQGTWKYQLPASAATGSYWKHGTKHTILVQGLDGLGQFGPTTTIHVTKGSNLDTNGDGYSDLLVSASVGNAAQGYAFIYLTNPETGIPSTLPDSILTDGMPNGTFFGDWIGAGDFNGDGYADTIVGSQATGGFLGRVYIFHSSGASGILSQNLNTGGTSNTQLSGVTGGGRLGTFVMGRDVNNDGYDDAVLSSPWNDEGFIFYSQGTSGIATQNTTTANRSYVPAANDNFGNHSAVGDINGDGYADLAISAPTFNSNQGRVYIYLSNGGVLPPSPQEYLLGPTSPSPGCTFTGGCNFGAVITLADFNGDNCADLGASGASFNTNQGIVFIFHSDCSSTSPYSSTPNTVLVGPSLSSCSVNTCLFGSSLSVGDTNGDGFPDLSVGTTSGSSGKGNVYLFSNTGNGIASVDLSSGGSAVSLLTGLATSTNFAQMFRLQDTNGDGLSDSLVSAPTANKVYYFKSTKDSGPGNLDLSSGGASTSVLTTSVGQSLGNSIAF